MNKYAHFGHVLHFSGLAYGRHRVQGVKIGGIQSSLLFPYLVPDSFMDLPRLFIEKNSTVDNPCRKKIKPIPSCLAR